MNPFSKIKKTLHTAWYEQKSKSLRANINRRYGQCSDAGVQLVLDYLNKHLESPLPLGMTPPYEWTKEYREEDVEVHRDGVRDLHYVIYRENKVYFPRKESADAIRQAVRIGLMEQDNRSPHSYVSGDFDIKEGDVGVFIGASDGLFCLSRLERLSKAYLFEPASHWHEPLRATFEPWADKVEIVPLGVADSSGDGQISLDDFFKGKEPPNFIQVDVDGVDWEVLLGARSIIKDAKKLRLALCTYHKRLDFQKFAGFLKPLGYEIDHSPGYYLIGVRMPYMRHGVLYASKLQ
jgi:hypothetical protein